MENQNSFTYTISSGNMTNQNATYHEGTIDLMPPNENYINKYFVQCTSFTITADTLDTATKPFYISLVVDGLAEKGYCQGLDSNQLILATITTAINGGGVLNSGEGSVFTIKDFKAVKSLKFGLYAPDMYTLTTVIAPYATVKWQCSLIFTPIS